MPAPLESSDDDVEEVQRSAVVQGASDDVRSTQPAPAPPASLVPATPATVAPSAAAPAAAAATAPAAAPAAAAAAAEAAPS